MVHSHSKKWNIELREALSDYHSAKIQFYSYK